MGPQASRSDSFRILMKESIEDRPPAPGQSVFPSLSAHGTAQRWMIDEGVETLSELPFAVSHKTGLPVPNDFLWSHVIGDYSRHTGTQCLQHDISKRVSFGGKQKRIGGGISPTEFLPAQESWQNSMRKTFANFVAIWSVTGDDDIDIGPMSEQTD